MSKFEVGNDPADHTVAEVTEFLKGDEVTSDEYDRVIAAERAGKGRSGIISGSGQEVTGDGNGEALPPVDDAAGPNERATGQQSPADEAKTVDDPDASGDAGVTADQYPDDAPSQLGPDMPQSAAEEAAHAATLAAADAAEVSSIPADDGDKPATQTPEEALKLAVERSTAWKTR